VKTISSIHAGNDWSLTAVFTTGETRIFNIRPLLSCEAFAELSDHELFRGVQNHGYYIEWPNGADLSGDTLYLDGKPVSATLNS
jgi:hypothetical protein